MLDFLLPWLFLLLPLPWLTRYLLPRANRASGSAIRVPFYRQLDRLRGDSKVGRGRALIKHLLMTIVWMLTLAAAANPVWIGPPQALPSSGRDLLLAVDISGSMREEDMASATGYQSRLGAVRDVAGDFVEQRSGDRLGLILFGEQAYLQTPLTFDRFTVQKQLTEATIAGDQGVQLAGGATAIGDAIGLAIKKLSDEDEESRVLILLTDGANTAGTDPLRAAQVAADERLRIHTIGVGTERAARSLFGFGNLTSGSDLDEETLRAIAQMTGGNYFRARDTRELQAIYALIDQLEPLPEDVFYRPQKSIFYWPLAGALLLSCLLLSLDRFSRVRLEQSTL